MKSVYPVIGMPFFDLFFFQIYLIWTNKFINLQMLHSYSVVLVSLRCYYSLCKYFGIFFLSVFIAIVVKVWVTFVVLFLNISVCLLIFHFSLIILYINLN